MRIRWSRSSRYTVTLGGRTLRLGPVSGLVAIIALAPVLVLRVAVVLLATPGIVLAYGLARMGV